MGACPITHGVYLYNIGKTFYHMMIVLAPHIIAMIIFAAARVQHDKPIVVVQSDCVPLISDSV